VLSVDTAATLLPLSLNLLSTQYNTTTQLRASLAVVYEHSQLPSLFPCSQGSGDCCAQIYDAAC